MQTGAAILCDYVLQLPLVPAGTSTESMSADTFTAASSTQTFAALANLPVATNTMRTTITFADGTLSDSAARFAVQKATAAEVVAMGDWHIELATGVITVYASSVIQPGAVYTVSYSNYASAPTGTNVSKFACVLGDVHPGDFLKVNADSNYVVATPKTFGDGVTDNFDTFADIVGQVLEVISEPRSLLDRVRTAYSSLSSSATGSYPGYAGQMDQMPGSATGGVGALVHYAGAADKLVTVNLISR
jgi:hypothetical protein